ncbi:MAG: M1 family peptidase [Bacteroidetes bacterium]|nr:MAG: M1 family peptidase [Bacteroidota bacterium]
MSQRLLLILLLLPAIRLTAQKTYFQQEVHYMIQATLDDSRHMLDARIRMEYINHAPDTLREIWMHLWANAYQNRKTAFCRQKLRDGNARFFFAPERQLGYFENLDFKVDEQQVAWQYDPVNPDIAVLKLAEPLPPGGKLVISTPFLLKIPASFSRLGHVGTSYQMTQWYPKPAVYDAQGWHAMPYLDVGEFYSEFGSFDVQITLPENYIVGATGTLQTPSEWAFLEQRERETRAEIDRQDKRLAQEDKKTPIRDTFPPSAAQTKTLRYTADQVHDFAWFADKRFYVLKDTARLSDGRTVDCWAMFTASDFNVWKKGAQFVRRSVEFYSQHVGPYPWPHATAVHSALSAGGGMEYPMITVIGDEGSSKSLDEVITHEVGHNWFYGILASNEREHPWMDEGLNSYYEHRYMVQYYGSDMMSGMLPQWAFDQERSGSIPENGYLMLAREGEDTPPDSHSDDFWFIAYGLQVYMKTAMCLEWLEQSIGKARFDQVMQAYYEKWKFRHPYPDDLRTAWQEAGLEADWFFKTMQTRLRFDMALTDVRAQEGGYRLTVKNKSGLPAPFSISAMRNGQPVQTIWYAAVSESAELDFPRVEADAFVLDQERATLDVNRKNNRQRVSGAFSGLEPLGLRMLALAENPSRTELGLLPWIAVNQYDKAIVGLLLYNAPFPPRRFQYFLLPGYAVRSNNLVGLADLKYRILPGGAVPKMLVGLNAKMFNYDYKKEEDTHMRYYRVMPQVRLSLRGRSPAFSHALNLRTLFISKEEARFEDEVFLGKQWEHAMIHEARYEAEYRGLPNPYQTTLALEWQNYDTPAGTAARYLRGSVEWKQHIYFARRRKFTARFFGGAFLVNTERNARAVATNNLSGDPVRGSFALTPQGYNDYRFDQQFVGRTEGMGFFAHQVSQTEGGFKNALGRDYAGVLGNSNSFILALNLKSDLPVRLPLGLPLKPYFDLGYFDDATPVGDGRPFEEQFLWSGGLMLEFFNGTLEVYFPLVHAKPIRDRYAELAGDNYFQRISWSIRIGRVTPLEVVQKLARN